MQKISLIAALPYLSRKKYKMSEPKLSFPHTLMPTDLQVQQGIIFCRSEFSIDRCCKIFILYPGPFQFMSLFLRTQTFSAFYSLSQVSTLHAFDLLQNRSRALPEDINSALGTAPVYTYLVHLFPAYLFFYVGLVVSMYGVNAGTQTGDPSIIYKYQSTTIRRYDWDGMLYRKTDSGGNEGSCSYPVLNFRTR